ncbi:GSCOCT00004188001.2-RA-CDS, partial [Cotesia congregata]
MLKIKISSYFIFRQIIKGLTMASGFWPSENLSLPYRLLSYMQLSLNFGMFLAIFNFVRLYAHRLALLIKSFGVMTTYLSSTLKITCFLINRKEALELHRILDPYFTKLAQDRQMKKIIFKKFTLLKLITWLFFFCVFITLSAMIITPLIDIAMQHHKPGKSIKYPLIYPSKYPWQTSSNGWAYKLTFLFETLATASLFCISLSVDSLFLFYIFQIIGQLREMGYCITHTDGYNEKGKDFVIRKAVYQYQRLIRAKEIIEKIYGPIVLWIMCTNAVIMCVFIFQSMQVLRLFADEKFTGCEIDDDFHVRSVKSITNVYIRLEWHLFDGGDYREALYNIDWYGSKKIMTSIIIMMAQKPMIVTALNFSTVTVDIFTMVMKTTISYFFLLQTLEEQ